MTSVLLVTRRVSHLQQELLTLPVQPSPSPVFSWVRVTRSLVFCVVFCRSLFVLFLLAVVLSVLLRFSVSDYLCGIFRLYFQLDEKQTLENVLKKVWLTVIEWFWKKKKKKKKLILAPCCICCRFFLFYYHFIEVNI